MERQGSFRENPSLVVMVRDIPSLSGKRIKKGSIPGCILPLVADLFIARINNLQICRFVRVPSCLNSLRFVETMDTEIILTLACSNSYANKQ